MPFDGRDQARSRELGNAKRIIIMKDRKIERLEKENKAMRKVIKDLEKRLAAHE